MTITPSPDALGVTLAQWVDQLHGEYLARREKTELDQLASAVTTTATSITLTHFATGVRPQVQVEIDDELLHVWGPTATEGQHTVRRGHGGSTAVQHSADALVRVGPRFPRIALARQLEREIRSWPVAIYATAVGDYDVVAGDEVIALTGLDDYEVIRLIRVQSEHADTANESWPDVPATLERLSTGYQIRLHGTAARAGTARVRVGYRHPVPALSWSADLGTAYHLNGALADAAMLGVAGRLLLTDEIDRSDDRAQPRPRRGEDVPPGHRMQTGQALLEERDRLLRMEAERLLSAYTPRF